MATGSGMDQQRINLSQTLASPAGLPLLENGVEKYQFPFFLGILRNFSNQFHAVHFHSLIFSQNQKSWDRTGAPRKIQLLI
jgi:hypothetical protein